MDAKVYAVSPIIVQDKLETTLHYAILKKIKEKSLF
jgi:hypothetical protein